MPPTLGQRLKHAREKRGLTLRDIEHTSKIPVARLQDLEDDKLNGFGGMTYAKAFLRTYANFLGVNADEVLHQIQTPVLGGVRDYRYLVESHGPWITDKTYHHRHSPLPQNTPAPNSGSGFAEGKSFLFAAIVCVAFALLIGGGVLANAYFGSKHPTANGANHSPGTDASAANGTVDAHVDGEDYEFSLFGVNITVVPDQVIDLVHPVPKAIPVPESMLLQPAPTKVETGFIPPKAEAVR